MTILDKIKRRQEVCWKNERCGALEEGELSLRDVEDAASRLLRFAPYFQIAFPETAQTGGIVESPLREIPRMKEALEKETAGEIQGRLYLKMDSHLPISGSVKARGGVYEVLKFAESLALRHGLLKEGDDYGVFAGAAFRELFSQYSIAVGSTGNLGLSIGIMGAKLGFRVTVHMSADAREWKKALLREKGVCVKEYESDYSEAVREGRLAAEGDPTCYFVDDENSRTLFLGYAVAALRLQKQLEEMKIAVSAEKPMYVYLPCGVGGAPGGICFGLKKVFGDSVRCYFAEPTAACCMLLGMCTGKHNGISVQEIGVDGKTAADGLAVGRASGFVGRLMENYVSGCYTVSDERMFSLLRSLADTEGIFLEPSALAGMQGPILVGRDPAFESHAPGESATHVVWATGGSMVPEDEMQHYYELGKKREG